jgi:uncharacterized protein (DUF1697 family)
MKYLALLRGINVGGKHAVPMADLRQCFEGAGFAEVSTYINSGNVIFESATLADAALVQKVTAVLEQRFGWPIACAVISADEFAAAMEQAPTWWNQDPTAKNNAIFVIAPATTVQVMDIVGEAKSEYESVAAAGSIIFWTTTFANFNRTRYSRMVGTPAYHLVTIRNAHTTVKLLALCQAKD